MNYNKKDWEKYMRNKKTQIYIIIFLVNYLLH
jgi:hypothetical protein